MLLGAIFLAEAVCGTQAFAQFNFSVVSAPTLPTGTLPIGTTYSNSFVVKNNGGNYTELQLTSGVNASVLYNEVGVLVPNFWDVVIVDSSTGAINSGQRIWSLTKTTAPQNGFYFPANTNQSFSYTTASQQDIMTCTTNGTCNNFLGGNNSYTMYFRIYDTYCSVTGQSNCVVYQLPLVTSTVNWAESNQTIVGQGVADKAGFPTFPIVASPIPKGQQPAAAPVPCTGKAATELNRLTSLAGLPTSAWCS
jgi:hypothetical protein